MREKVELSECVTDHVHIGTHDGQERGLFCQQCHDGLMGHPEPNPYFVTFEGQKREVRSDPAAGWDVKIVVMLYALFGSFLGFLIFTFGLGNFRYVFMGKAESMWRGPLGLLLALGGGATLGLLAWKHRHFEFHGLDDFTEDDASAILFSKRIMVLISCAVGAYFLWQLAKGI